MEPWTAPASPRYDLVASNPASSGRTFPDQIHDLVHVSQGTKLAALRESDLTEVASITTPSVSNPGGVIDRETGTVFLIHAGRPRAYTWNPETQTYDSVQLPGNAVSTNSNSRLAYDVANDRLVHVALAAITTWTRTEAGWVRADYALTGLTNGFRLSMAVDDAGTVLLTESSAGSTRTMPRTVVFGDGVATLVPITTGVPVPTNYDTDWIDVHAVSGGRAYLVTRLGVVQELRRGPSGYEGHGPTFASGVPAYVTFSSYEDRMLYIVGSTADIAGIRDGRIVHSVRAQLAYYGFPAAASGNVYPWDTDAGLLRFTRTATSPEIAIQPQDVTATEGDAVTLSAAATADPAPAVRWQTRPPGATSWKAWTDIDGATGTDLTVSARPEEHGRQYRAVFENAAGALATAAAAVSVLSMPVVAAQPDDVTVVEGEAAQLKVLTTGNPHPEVTWQRRVAGFWTTLDPDAGAFEIDGGFLTVLDANLAMSGAEFRARVRNRIGTRFSRVARLTVTPAPPQVVTFGAGHVDWGVKESFRTYIGGPIAHGSYAASDGAAVNLDGTIRFDLLGGTYDTVAATGELLLAGAVRFTGHDGLLDLRIADAKLVLAGATGTLVADVTSRSLADGVARTFPGVALATLDLSASAGTPVTGGLAFDPYPAALTSAGAPAFADFYPAGTALDPIALTALYGTPRERPRPPATEQPPPSGQQPSPPPSGGEEPPAGPKPLSWALPKRAVKVGGTGRALVAAVTCPEACRIAVRDRMSVKIRGERHRVTFSHPARVPAGGRAPVRARLGRAARAALRGRTLTVRVKVTVTTGGRATARTVVVRLRA